MEDNFNKKDFFLNDNRSGYKCKGSFLLKNHPTIYNEIFSHSKKHNILSDNIVELIWYYINDVSEKVSCYCGMETKFIGLKQGFSEYCSRDCSRRSPARANKMKKTIIERYGVDNISKLPESKEKRKQTNIEKYGVENVSQSDDVKEKRKQTNIERYGVGNVFESSNIQEKIKETVIERYGVDHPSKSVEVQEKKKTTNINKYGVDEVFKASTIQEKIKETVIERYGVENILQSDDIRDKIKSTNIKRYGFESPLSSDEIKDKIKSTTQDRYGVEYIGSSDEIKDKIKRTNLSKYGVESTLNDPSTINKIKETNIERYGVETPIKNPLIRQKIIETLLHNFGVDNPTKSQNIQDKIKQTKLNQLIERLQPKYIFKNISGVDLELKGVECGCDFKIHRDLIIQRLRFNMNICTKCNPIGQNSVSNGELELTNFIKSLNIDVVESDREVIKPYEIDMYLPKYKLGIEYNGLYWHSDKYKIDTYHLDKSILCSDKSVKLIHIFEDEWLYKKDIVKSRLLNLLSLTPNKIYARKCVIKEVTSKETKEFLIVNHIQGNVNSSHRLGLYYNDELVSLMTFGSLRKNLGQTAKEGSFELLRFCNKLNTNVVGGASKLFKYFTDSYSPEKIISYADVRWSGLNEETTLYSQLGFNFVSLSKPNYYYIKNNIRENRFKYRKSELVKQGFDPNKTERLIMAERGYLRIYDCGALSYEYKKDSI